jgi:hypothetical protein
MLAGVVMAQILDPVMAQKVLAMLTGLNPV